MANSRVLRAFLGGIAILFLAGVLTWAFIPAPVDTDQKETDCFAAGGRTVTVGSEASCVVNGAVVAEWTTP